MQQTIKSALSSVAYSTCFQFQYIKFILIKHSSRETQTRSKGEELHACYHVILHKISCAAPEGKCKWVTAPSTALYCYPGKATLFLSSPDIELLDISQILLCSSSSFGRIFADFLLCQREWKNILSQDFFWWFCQGRIQKMKGMPIIWPQVIA